MESLFGKERSRQISTALLVFLIILSVFFVIKSITEMKQAGQIGVSPEARPTIRVSGEGEVMQAPDVGSFNFAVSEQEENVENAQETVTEDTNAILSFLEEEGVEEKDIQTSGYNVYPRYEYRQEACTELRCPPGKQVLVGYEVRQNIEVTVRDLENVGTLLSGVGERGASNISSLRFKVDEEKSPYRQARQMAINDAKEQARVLAKDLGVRLVRIVDFQESGNTPYPILYKEEAFGRGGDSAASSAPTIPTGENTYTSRVTIIYEIR